MTDRQILSFLGKFFVFEKKTMTFYCGQYTVLFTSYSHQRLFPVFLTNHQVQTQFFWPNQKIQDCL